MYDLNPKTRISEDNRIHYDLEILKSEGFIVVETYPGVNEEILESFKGLGFDRVIETKDLFISEDRMNQQLQSILTDDRVRGKMYFGEILDFIDPQRLQQVKESISSSERTLIYGVGASLVSDLGVLVYADVTRWEIQLRYRQGMPNLNASNYEDENLVKYKRGYFVDWRVADKLKAKLLESINFYMDTTILGQYKMVTKEDYFSGLDRMVEVPFRLVPYFDPGVWGGSWMKENFNLPENHLNYAWSFDGVPEENSLNLEYGEDYIQTPAMNLVLLRPHKLMGKRVVERFGHEFPIRFDLLDTMGGQNLSLQVHPPLELARKEFGMAYTQSESYYLLEAKLDGMVYLGVKDHVDQEEMFHELREAQAGRYPFDAKKYVNLYPAKKHDHFLIPPGTIHCSGKNTLVLEISHTPYIFTFKLWDWGRVDLNGIPRPTHIDLGEQAINFDYDTNYVQQHFINRSEVIYQDENHKIEKTGLPAEQALDTYRISVHGKLDLKNHSNVSMLNLVEGDFCFIVTSDFKLKIHYAETFIIPAHVEQFSIVSEFLVVLMRAQVR